MTTPKIIASGGFNTGRLYTAEGQQIFWSVYSDGWVCLRDRSRMVECWFEDNSSLHLPGGVYNPATGQIDPRSAMRIYDSPMSSGWFHYGPDERRNDMGNRAPKDFDFGPWLKI